MTSWRQRWLASDRDSAAWVRAVVAILPVYLVTAHWNEGQVSDCVAAIWPAWNLAHHGTFYLEHATGMPDLPWFTVSGGHVVSGRMMGVLLIGVPFAYLTSLTSLSPEATGALTAAVVTTLALANIHVLLRTLVGRFALPATAVLAFGTTLWTTAGAELWTHGPDALWLSAGMLAASRHRYWLAGLAMAPAVMTRPHLAVVAAALGTSLALSERRLRPLWQVGVPTAAGLGGLVLWNAWYFGSAMLGARTYDGRLGKLTAAPTGGAAAQWAGNAVGAFVSPACGVLLYSPVLLVLLVSAPAGWRAAPAWVRGAAVGGMLYEAVQLRLNGYTGGGGFYGNRLVVEMLVLVAPLLAVGLGTRWGAAGRGYRRSIAVLSVASLAMRAFGALSYGYWWGTSSSALVWYPAVVARALGILALPVAAVSVLAAVAVVRGVASQMTRTAAPAPV